jgi:prepilin-type processing-associated H-X9-DG protein
LIELLVVIAIISILAATLFPAFAQVREKARQTVCLSNLHQIGLAFLQYEQDYNESFPLVCEAPSGPTPQSSWTATMQPYLRSKPILRCPDDNSTLWTSGVRYSSYAMNAWMTSNAPKPYSLLAQIDVPSSVIYMTENSDASTVDHFPPYCWSTTDPIYNAYGMEYWCPEVAPLDSNGYPTAELAWNRHQGGFNSMYVDGHAQWNKWSQVWFQNASLGVYEGGFDPRQQ